MKLLNYFYYIHIICRNIILSFYPPETSDNLDKVHKCGSHSKKSNVYIIK